MHNSNSAQVVNGIEIYNLLKNIQKSKQPISLSFESLPQLCLTSLLDVQKDKKILTFDEPNPVLSNEQVEKRNEVEFSLKLQNLPVIFRTKFISNRTVKNTGEFQTYFPKEIYYPQTEVTIAFEQSLLMVLKQQFFYPQQLGYLANSLIFH